MKLTLFVIVGIVTLAFAFWVVVVAPIRSPLSTPLMLVLILVFGVPPMGSFWMLYNAVRYERQPFPIVLLAFLPFSFIWYYFERVRNGRHLTR